MKCILLCALFLALPLSAKADVPELRTHQMMTSEAIPANYTIVSPVSGDVVFADVQAPSGLVGVALNFLLEHWEYLLTFLLSLPFAAHYLTDKRKKTLADGIYHAFWAVEDLKSDADLKGTPLDKVEAGLKLVNDYMVGHGWRPLKPGEADVAKIGFKSLNARLDASTDVPPQAPTKA